MGLRWFVQSVSLTSQAILLVAFGASGKLTGGFFLNDLRIAPALGVIRRFGSRRRLRASCSCLGLPETLERSLVTAAFATRPRRQTSAGHAQVPSYDVI